MTTDPDPSDAARPDVDKSAGLDGGRSEDFIYVTRGGADIVLRAEYADALLAMPIENPAALADIDGAEMLDGGRGAVLLVPFGPPDASGQSDERLVIRHCRRGGVFGKFAGDLYLGVRRARREMQVSFDAAEAGILTPEIVAVVHRRALGPLYRSDVISLEVPEGVTVGEYLAWYPATPTREVIREKRRVIEATGRTVRAMHDAGLYHGDLNVGNLLLRRGRAEVQVYILDLDNARMLGRVTPRMRRKELMRLNRSIMKMRLEPCPMDDEDRLLFLRCYGSDAIDAEPSRLLASCRRQVRWHSILWRHDET